MEQGVAVLCENAVVLDAIRTLLESHERRIVEISECACRSEPCEVIVALPRSVADAMEILAHHPRHRIILLMNGSAQSTPRLAAGAFAVETSLIGEDALLDLIARAAALGRRLSAA